MTGMDAGRIEGFQPTYGVGSLKHDRDRRSHGQSFEQAFEEEDEDDKKGREKGVASDDTPERPKPRGLQRPGGIIRKDEENGELHVDVVV